DYLLGTGEGDARLAPLLAAAEPEPALPLPPDARAVLDRWGEAWEATWHSTAPLILFHGRYGTGKRAAASYLAPALGRPLLQLDARALAASDLPPTQIFRLAEREARLTGAVLAWSHADGLLQPPPGSEAEQRAFARALAAGRVPTILLAEKAWEPARDLA